MPRTAAPKHTITIPQEVWNDLETHLGTDTALRSDAHAVLAGTTDAHSTTVTIAVADDEDDQDRTTKRRYALEHDLDVIGQVHLTYENLDQTIARTTTEQEGRRQEHFSLPEGHVFLHVHHIAGEHVLCAHIVKNRKLHHAKITIKARDENTPRKNRKPRKPTTALTDEATAVSS